MLLWVKTRILTFWIRGWGGAGKSGTVTTRHVTDLQHWVESKSKTQLWRSEAKNESVKSVIQNFWQKMKRFVFFTSKIFHITCTLCLVKSYFDFDYSRQCRSPLDTHSLLTLIIMVNEKWFLSDLIQVIFHGALASFVGVKDGTLTSRAVTLVSPKIILGNNL